MTSIMKLILNWKMFDPLALSVYFKEHIEPLPEEKLGAEDKDEIRKMVAQLVTDWSILRDMPKWYQLRGIIYGYRCALESHYDDFAFDSIYELRERARMSPCNLFLQMMDNFAFEAQADDPETVQKAEHTGKNFWFELEWLLSNDYFGCDIDEVCFFLAGGLTDSQKAQIGEVLEYTAEEVEDPKTWSNLEVEGDEAYEYFCADDVPQLADDVIDDD